MRHPNPGKALRQEFIEPLRVTAYRVANDCALPHSAMSQILNGKRAITAETALRLAGYFGTRPQFWMNLQMEYDMRQAKRQIQARVERDVKPLARAAARMKIKPIKTEAQHAAALKRIEALWESTKRMTAMNSTYWPLWSRPMRACII